MAAAPAPDLKTLGRYNIERTLGKGAMGVVYEGVDPRLGRRVAIKTILKSHLDEDTAKDYSMRFVREAQAVARLNHPNIVQVYDFGEEGDIAYLAEVIHLHDVRMVEPRDGLGLAHEPHRVILGRVLVEVALQDRLDRDAAAEARVDALVDDAHGALAEGALDVVTT